MIPHDLNTDLDIRPLTQAPGEWLAHRLNFVHDTLETATKCMLVESHTAPLPFKDVNLMFRREDFFVNATVRTVYTNKASITTCLYSDIYLPDIAGGTSHSEPALGNGIIYAGQVGLLHDKMEYYAKMDYPEPPKDWYSNWAYDCKLRHIQGMANTDG